MSNEDRVLRLLAYSDIHHGVERLQETIRVEEQITDYCIKNSIKTVIFLGDRYKKRDPQGWVKDAVDDVLMKRSRLGIRMLVVVGNHDQYDKTREYTSCGSFGIFKVDNILVAEKHVTVEIGKFKIYLFPFGSFNADFKRGVLEQDSFNIFCGHGIIEGALASDSSDFRFKNGIKKEDLSDFDLVLCGDVHLPQRLEFAGSATGGYVGSVLQLTKADINSERGFLDIECSIGIDGKKDMKWEFVKSDASEFMEIDINQVTRRISDGEIDDKYKGMVVYVKVSKFDASELRLVKELRKKAKSVFVVQEKEFVENVIEQKRSNNVKEDIENYIETVETGLDKEKLKEYVYKVLKAVN